VSAMDHTESGRKNMSQSHAFQILVIEQ